MDTDKKYNKNIIVAKSCSVQSCNGFSDSRYITRTYENL